jgi:hypothetical protein
MGEPEIFQVVAKLLFELALLLPGLFITGHHPKLAKITHLVTAITHNLYQIMEIIS